MKQNSPKTTNKPLIYRLHRTVGPLAGGMILDALDLATFGPIGFLGGFLIAIAVGWWISSIYDFPTKGRVLFAALAGVYAAIPMTELFPIATAISAIARFREKPEADINGKQQ